MKTYFINSILLKSEKYEKLNFKHFKFVLHLYHSM